ncbi:unnamed protein product [Closterium sp. NIES-54]
MITSVTVHLLLPTDCFISPSFHVTLLRPYIPTTSQLPHHRPPSMTRPASKPIVEPEKILSHGICHPTGIKRIEFLVRWKDRMPTEDSWVSESQSLISGIKRLVCVAGECAHNPRGQPHMEGVKKFTGRELEQATNKFHRENSLGRGGFGTGYKGQIDGRPVLVMKLNPDTSRQAGERFLREVTVLTRADHRHIVQLIGYNAESRCIVYEALPGGNLEDRLATEAGRKSLRQKDRLRIAAEVAEALVFLHRLDYPILHQDVKPANVMLDDDLISKLGGVGLAKFLPVNDSSIWGTVGYIDPLLLRTGKYGPQSDVYGLGLVVLQLLTGEKVNKVLEYAKFGLEGVLEHLDKEVTWNDKIVRDVAELALRCRDKANRPDLESVVLPALQILAKDTALDLDQDGAPPPRQAAGSSGARGGGGRGGHAGGRGAGRGAGEDAHKAAQASAAKKSTSMFSFLWGGGRK